MTELEEREHVASLALEWERTPYIHEGRIKGKCADCTFFAKVFEEAGLIPFVPIPHYSPQAHINRQACLYMNILLQYAKREVEEAQAQVGDVVMFCIGRTWSHGGVIIPPGWPNIIHADMGAKCVTRDWGDNGQLRRFKRRFFSFWE